jgi:hypothetical protein
MSLWTPGGEVPVNRPGEPEAAASEPERQAAPQRPMPPGVPDLEDLSPEERAQVEEMVAQMAEAQRQIAATPAAQIVATHAGGLYELAAIKLQQQPPQLGDARLAIDALVAVVDAVGDRLGEDSETLRDAVSQVQRAYVQINSEAG